MRSRVHAAPWALLAVMGIAGCRGGESDLPPVHLIPNMDTQEKGRAYRRDSSGLFGDARTMRPPVEGTVAQGQLAEDDLLELGLSPEGQPSTKFPASIKVDDALRARGRERYQIYCAPCHGVAADGKGTVAARGLVIPPPSFHDARLKEMPVGTIYSAMRNGVNNDNMMSYASQIPVADRWAIIAGIRAMQRDRDPNVQDEGGKVLVVAKVDKASAEHGAALFKAKTCVACHSLDGSRLVGPSFKGLFGRTEQTSAGEVVVDAAYLKESVLQPNAKIVKDFPPAMPPVQLSDIEIESLILFIQAQK